MGGPHGPRLWGQFGDPRAGFPSVSGPRRRPGPRAGRYTTDSPARALALAVLGLAIDDLLGRGPVSYGNGKGSQARERWRTRMAAEAHSWIDADDPGDLYSFASLCSVLGLDPAGVR